MHSPVEHIRLNKKGRDQLIKLRRSTGIGQWNILCRWAFCVSLRDKSFPPAVDSDNSMNVEISWKVFSGEYSDVFTSLMRDWSKRSGVILKDEGELVRQHIQRGLSILDSNNIDNVSSLSRLINEPTTS